MPTNPYPQFLLLGDSILQNASLLRDNFSFVCGLQEHCLRRLDVINRGLSGYTTANVLEILQHLLPSPTCAKVDYILILLGANDACLPHSPSGQHVPLQSYRENLKTILTHPSVTAHKAAILLVTPPPVHETHLQKEDLSKGYPAVTRLQTVTAQYADAVREIAADSKDQNVILVDLHAALMDEAVKITPGYVPGKSMLGSLESGDNVGLRHLLLDGLHFTGAGYKVFLDAVVPHVGKGWADEPFDKPVWIFPHWSIAPRIDKK